MKVSDLFQKLIKILNQAAMGGQHFAVLCADKHSGSPWVAKRLSDLALFVRDNGVRCPELLLKGFDPFGIVSKRQPEELDVLTQCGIFLDRVVEPVNYRRALLASRSENAHCID